MFNSALENLTKAMILFYRIYKEKNTLFFFNLLNKYRLNATDGPIPKANNKVPIPTIPPKNHQAKLLKFLYKL